MSKAKKLTELRAQNHGDPIHRDLRPIHSEASLEEYFKSLLSPEEIERELEQYKDQIETVRDEFKKRTAIHVMDIPFLILATAFEQEIQMAASSSAFAGSAGVEAALTL